MRVCTSENDFIFNPLMRFPFPKILGSSAGFLRINDKKWWWWWWCVVPSYSLPEKYGTRNVWRMEHHQSISSFIFPSQKMHARQKNTSRPIYSQGGKGSLPFTVSSPRGIIHSQNLHRKKKIIISLFSTFSRIQQQFINFEVEGEKVDLQLKMA